MREIFFCIAGVCFGLIGGMGMGGGIILIPVLTLFLGVSQHAAQGLNLAAFLPMSIFALAAHIKAKRIDYKKSLILCAAGIPAAIGGAVLAHYIDKSLLKILFGALLVLLGGWRSYKQIAALIKKNKSGSKKPL